MYPAAGASTAAHSHASATATAVGNEKHPPPPLLDVGNSEEDEAKQAVEEDEDDDDALTPDSQKSWPRLPRCGSSKTLEALQVGEEGAQIAACPGSTTAAEQVTNAASEVLVSAEEQHGRVEPGSSAGVALRGESHARVESEIRAEAVKDGSAGGNVMAVPLRQLAFDYSLPSSDASSQGGVPLSAAGDQGVGIPGSSWLPPPPVSETQLQKGVDDWTDAVSQGVEAGHENLLQQLDLIVPASSDACQAPQNTLPTPHLQAAAGKEGTQHGQVDADKTGLQHDGQVMAAMPLAPGEEDDEEQIMLAALEMAERQLCAASSSRGKTCAPDVVSPALAANEPSSPQPPQPVPQDASRMAGGADAQGSKCCAHVSKTADVPFVGDVGFVECADRARQDAALGVCLAADEGEEKGMDLPAAAVQKYSQEAETGMCHCGSGVCVCQ